MLDETDETTGVWTDALAERDGLRCEFCDGKIVRFQPIAIAAGDRVMHKNCFEDQPTSVITPRERD